MVLISWFCPGIIKVYQKLINKAVDNKGRLIKISTIMNLGGYIFTDPKQIGSAGYIDRAAVYVVMTRDGVNWYYLYVGQAGDVAQRFDTHEKWNCWLNNKKNGELWVSIHLESNKDQRLIVETYLRKVLPGLPCNKQ
jgi:predicted GIY-YIG superfamily endonuclease